MSTQVQSYSEEYLEMDYGKVHLMKGGTGKPLLVYQDDLGSPGWLPFYEELAKEFTVYVPAHPGFGKSERPDWMRNVRDLAIVNHWFLNSLGLDQLWVVGVGFGGWVAAEMAVMCKHRFDKIVLVGAVGIQPPDGEILDQFLLSGEEYARLCFQDQAKFDNLYGAETDADQREAWEVNREMAIRIAWRPYMFDQALPHLLGSVDTPTLVIAGKEDKVVPESCAKRYLEVLPNSRMEVLEDCGHCADVEKPHELAGLISGFIS
jgi:pimeloyl-ACP methyl ester carboxylesterase